MITLFWVAIGGALGAVARYGVAVGSVKLLGNQFPYGTLIVNTLGAFAALFILTLLSEKLLLVPALRLFAVVGFLGAFTTFSTYTYETILFIEAGEWGRALWNMLINNGLSLAAGVLGIAAARAMVV
ncbi:MAG: fluoride efflux transporter CrcB [Campylobacterales bacterium]